jgi:hypothetical protein
MIDPTPDASPQFPQGIALTDGQTLADIGFETVEFFYHTKSRHVENSEALLARLGHCEWLGGIAVNPHETSLNHERNVSELTNIKTRSLFVVSCGDGGTNLALSAAVETGQGPWLVVGAGNADDGAHQMHSAETLERPELLLKDSVIKPLHPLDIAIESKDGEQSSERAFFYLGFGIDALTAATYNNPKYRNSFWHKKQIGTNMIERLAAAKDFFRAKRFLVNDQPKSEVVISNGSRMAKVFKIHANLFKDEARLIQANNKFSALRIIQALRHGKAIGTPITEPLKMTVKGNPTFFWQRDGEDQRSDKEMTFTISRSPKSVDVLVAPELDV